MNNNVRFYHMPNVNEMLQKPDCYNTAVGVEQVTYTRSTATDYHRYCTVLTN